MAIFETSLRNPDIEFKDWKWYKAVKKRMKYEEGTHKEDLSGLNFLPSKTEHCSPSTFITFDSSCKLGLFNHTGSDYFVKV